MNKILFFFLALFVAVVAGQNTTSSCEWILMDSSSATTFSIQFWNEAASSDNSTGYWVNIPTWGDQMVMVSPVTTPGYVPCNSTTGWSKTVTVSSMMNGTSAIWYLTANPESDKYISAQVQYSGFQNTMFTWEGYSMASAMNGNATNVTVTSSADTEVVFGAKDAFFKIKTTSVSFTSAAGANETNPDSDLAVSVNSTTGSMVTYVTVLFADYPNDNSKNYTAQNVTIYFGAGSAPGNHLLLIILVSVGGAVLLSIIIFVVIFVVRRRRNYERID